MGGGGVGGWDEHVNLCPDSNERHRPDNNYFHNKQPKQSAIHSFCGGGFKAQEVDDDNIIGECFMSPSSSYAYSWLRC